MSSPDLSKLPSLTGSWFVQHVGIQNASSFLRVEQTLPMFSFRCFCGRRGNVYVGTTESADAALQYHGLIGRWQALDPNDAAEAEREGHMILRCSDCESLVFLLLVPIAQASAATRNLARVLMCTRVWEQTYDQRPFIAHTISTYR